MAADAPHERSATIKRRLVCQVAGYDPVDAERHRRRFLRGSPTFARTWNVTVSATGLVQSGDQAAHWTVTTCGPNWRTDTTFQPLVWSDIVAGDFTRPMPKRLALYMAALFDLIRSGAVFRYFHARWKYGFFCIYPAIYLLAFALVGIALGYGVAAAASLFGVWAWLVMALTAAAVFSVLMPTLGRRWRVTQALDDWIFSSDYLHGRRPDAELRLHALARQLAEAARDQSYDEIVVIGHSLGATIAVNVVARALDRDPAFGQRGVPVMLLTVGSTIPKFTLHPDAVRIRLDVSRVAGSSVLWAEFHARADPISFYRFDPLTGMKTDDRVDRMPLIRTVRIRNMVELATYRRIQWQFMRIHHQFVMANERRAEYDFYMMTCGPIPIERAVMTAGGPDALLAPDGSFARAAAAIPDAPVALATG